YGRHLVIPEVGPEGQQRLKAARVLLVGAGGLGSPLALYLAAAGVGRLGLVDFDRVEASNLQRQLLFGEADLGRDKVAAAAARLHEVNPHVEVVPHALRLTAANALELLRDYEVVADGSDNFATRYLVNDACVLLGKPDVWGAVQRFEGQLAVFWAARGPCYRCLFPEPPPAGVVPSCAEAGVLGVLPGIVGALQAAEVLKLLLGIGEPAVGRLLVFDALRLRFRELALRKDPQCPVCSARPTQRGLVDYPELCGDGPPAAEVRVMEGRSFEEAWEGWEVDPMELQRWRQEGRDLQLIDVRQPVEHTIGSIAGATLIPLAELPRRVGELDPARPVVVHCHHGPRSLHATQWLREQGFPRVLSLAGGIEAWSRDVDPDVPRY
ncbi:MAG TPA: molybdopterin-synthase adenylyltransferase MoeB, partial [Thermoanaerobaculia bacterium]|nr:molybdopterin-synthase adenylyltransferase MoeB [Thermoanaerobaculia bacterium]